MIIFHSAKSECSPLDTLLDDLMQAARDYGCSDPDQARVLAEVILRNAWHDLEIAVYDALRQHVRQKATKSSNHGGSKNEPLHPVNPC